MVTVAAASAIAGFFQGAAEAASGMVTGIQSAIQGVITFVGNVVSEIEGIFIAIGREIDELKVKWQEFEDAICHGAHRLLLPRHGSDRGQTQKDIPNHHRYHSGQNDLR